MRKHNILVSLVLILLACSNNQASKNLSLDEYTIDVNSNIEYLDSIILDKEKEIKIVYWVFRPQDIGLR